MLCINKDSKEFKYLANRFKVSTDSLAEIIYKYYEEIGSSDNFPSDTYIQAQLGNRKFVSNSPLERTLWEKDYKTPKYFSSSSEWEAAKTKAKSFFPDSAIHSYENIDGYYVLRIEEPVEKFEPLHRKDFESWKEYNDYVLAMKDLIPAESRDKENQVIGKQNFTFKDGTSITVPFKPNEQQEEALNTLNDFLHGDETVITLSGYAGTGKTSLMEIIAKKAKKDGINIVFSASTNKAASVLKNRVKKAGFTAQTLNKVFGIQVEVDSSKPYDASNLISKLKEADISKGTVVVIDEASMINTENYGILNNIAEDNGLKIIYVGDQGQLPPVKESQVSKVFRGTEGRTINLTKVERTDDNAILKEATAIRNGKSLSGESSFNSEGKGVAYIKNSNKASIKAIVEKFVPQLRTNPDYFRILAYTNSAVSKYNEAVRKTLGYTDSKPRVGEPIVGYSNWGYIYDSRTKTGTYKFINSEAYTVVNVDTPTEVSTIIGSNTRISMQAIPITLEDSDGKRQRINFIDIKENSRNRQNAIILAKEKARLFDEARHLPARQKVPLLQEVNSIEQFLFVNDDIIDNGRTLQKKVFDFGYAMTVHKSQGSTFTHVLIDDADIAKSASGNTNMFADVALNFEEPNYDSVEFEGDVALDFSKAPDNFGIGNTIPSSRATNIRQQLEYVAVSRATDTVTIISNNVKTEDSPLNHIPKSNMQSSSPALENTTTTNRKEMTLQQSQQQIPFEYSRNANGRPNYEVSSRGDKRFSAMTATFAPGTTLFGHDVSGRTIESVYQHGVKQGDWTTDNNHKTGVPKDKTIITGNTENDSYTQGYLPLWQEWARQNPQLIEELRQKAQGKVLTDMFASTAVSQARALADILNSTINQQENRSNSKADLIAATIAPYFNTSYQDYISMSPEQQKQMREAFSKVAHKVAKALGITLDMKQASFNIGGYQFEDGGSVVEPSFTFRFGKDATPEQVEMFANLMGDLGFEQQEAVVSNYDVEDDAEADGFRRSIEVPDVDVALKILAEVGIKNFTLDKTNKVLSVLSFDSDDIIKFDNFVTRLNNGLEETERRNPRTTAFKSSYNEKESRRAGYQAWLQKHGTEAREGDLYNLIQEALSKLQEPKQAPVPETTPSGNFRTYGDAYTKVERDNLVQELLDDGYSREDIQVQHTPATETEDDYYIVKVRDNIQTAVDAVVGIEPSPTPSVTTPQRIELPGYGYLNGLYEDIVVDAAWKIPILQDLDSQLSAGNTEEENMEIIAQMDRVLQAISEEDYNKTPTAERQEVNQKMTDYERRNTQINNLIDNNVGLTATDIREVSQQIVDAISDIISEIKRNPNSVKEIFPYYSSTIDLTKATRKEIAKAVSIDALIAKAKENFENLRFNEDDDATYEFYDDDRVLDQADLILDNWETVIEFAADAFLLNEGFSIKRNTDKQVFETEDREFTGYDYDNYVDPQDEDATREEKDEQEHWQVESRTIGVMNSMSDLVRLALHECYELDSNGNIVKSKWGIPKRINKAVAVNNILKWTQGTLNINEMIDRLSQRRNKDYWVSQLIQRLQDSTGEQSDFQSQFYGVMHRHFQLYSNGKYENGVFKTQYLNSRNNALNTLRSIYGLFQLKSHPLFTSTNNVNQENLKVLKGWYDNLKALTKKYSISKDNNGQLTKKGNLSQEDFNTAVTNLTAASKMLGHIVNEETMQRVVSEENLFDMQKALRFIVQALEKQSESKAENYDPFNYDVDNNIRGEMLDFLTPIVEESDNDTSNAFFEGGKMYQSYVIPSFLTQLFDQFKQPSDKIYTWMNDFYGKSEWFKDRKGNWRNGWLDLIYRSPKAREIFDHKVQLNFNKHDYMRNMTPEELTISFFTEYFSERIDTKNVSSTPVWFRVPIQSNKPSSEFIRFYADRSQEYKDNIVKKMYSMFLQEVSRIDTVRKRNKSENDDAFISSFDENGRKFMFLPFLNAFLLDNGKQVAENTYGIFRLQNDTIDKEKVEELKKLLNKKVDAKVALTPDEDVRLEKLVQEATKDFLQHRADNILNAWDASGVLKAAEKVQGIKSLNHTVRENVENFLWNDYYAANNILQLTIVDKAFYPNATELQKRLAELHAPGTRGNKYATDYKGNRVSDGYYRTLIIRDFKGFISNVIDNISTIFDRKIEAASESEKAGLIALKEALVGDNGAYRRINVTDAQAYLSPSAYRKKALMFGKWSHAAEEIYQRLKGGNYNLTDLQLAFQPLKPFVYGHVSKNLGVSNAPITNMPVPMQAKNAEYLLIMAGALTESTDTGRPNLLKVIHDIMEESEERNPTKGIDTIQFDSAIKSGGQGIIDISGFANSEDGEIRAAAYIRSLIYQDNKSDDGTNYNYDTYIQKTDYDNYALQQEVPAHFKDHQQAEGSQQRMNIPADLDFYDYNGDVNYYTWKDSQGNEHSMNAKEIRKEYEEVHAKNIRESYNSLVKDLHLDSSDKKARNLALSEILQEEIMSSPRYGIDLFQACQIDPATGEFRIPKGDPIHAKRIEQLCNSIIKNRVNKQKIAGGPIVQVTNFGTSKQLHIRFHDKNGGLIPLESEYKAEEHDGKTYKEYIRENQAGIAEFEVFAPASSKKMLEIFQNPDGSINIDAVRRCDPELLKLITGRIPNEDKYSIAHARIVGFLPALAGEAIMFPYELTEIDDSDFDVDKRYTMRKEMDIVIDYGKVRRGLINAALRGLNKFKENNKAGYEKWARQKGWGKSDRDIIAEQVDMFLNDPERMKDSDSLMQSMYKEYQRIIKEDFPYKTRYPKEGTRAANNNQIFDMSWAILSNEMTADKMLNPGGFEIPKHTAYVINAYKNKSINKTWEELDAMKTKDLQKLSAVERDLALVEDHIQYYKQNAAGSNLIGVFAVNKVAHAILEGDNILVSIPDFCGSHFTVCNTEFKDLMPLDEAKDSEGNLVGKNIGSGVGASADTAKDPWLDLINTNMTTAGMFNTLMRMSMPMNDVELFMAQPAITNLLIDFNRRNLVESVSLDQLLGEKLGTVANAYGYTNESIINTQPLTKDELKERLRISDQDTSEEKDTIDYKVLLAFSKIKALSEAVRKPTAITRFNSMAATVGPLIIDNLILEQKLQKFLLSESDPDEGTGFYVKNEDDNLTPVDADYILSNHPILREFSRPADLRDPMCISKILFSDMPAGSYDFKVLLNSLPSNIKDRIYDDRQLLSSFSDFYQSYMLVANGVIKPENIRNILFGLPDEFVGKGLTSDGKDRKSIKEQYPDNPFIQAIQLDYDKKSGRAFLNISTTGMDERAKERLRVGWTDLHKVNPDLSTRLFTYAFFRGGVGFSPKTFMSLVPVYVKEHIKGYVDTYRHFPYVTPKIVIQQFVRNNWDNYTLAPIKGGEGTNYIVEPDNGRLFARDRKDVEGLKGITFMRTIVGKETYLWELVGEEYQNIETREYKRIMPLGNNGEYIEMSLEDNMKAMETTVTTKDRQDAQEFPALSPAEKSATDAEKTVIPMSEAKQAQNITDVVTLISKQNGLNREQAKAHFEALKERVNSNRVDKYLKSYLVRVFQQAGVTLTQENALKEFKKFC